MKNLYIITNQKNICSVCEREQIFNNKFIRSIDRIKKTSIIDNGKRIYLELLTEKGKKYIYSQDEKLLRL